MGIRLALALAGLWLAIFSSGSAQATCPVPNPNLTANGTSAPFVDGCPVPAAGLNHAFASAGGGGGGGIVGPTVGQLMVSPGMTGTATGLASTPGNVAYGGVGGWISSSLQSLMASLFMTQPAYFGTGYPFCDVRAHGALGNGSSDDTAAFTGCVSQLATTGGTIYVPPSSASYCVDSGVVLNVNGLILKGASPAGNVNSGGAGQWGSVIDACGNNVNVVTASNYRITIRDLEIRGYNSPTATNHDLVINGNCVECLVQNVNLWNGYYGVNITGATADTVLDNVRVDKVYGPAQVIIQPSGPGAVYIRRAKLDSEYPMTPSVGISDPAARPSSPTAVATGSIYTLNGFYIQYTSGGTTGAGTPTVGAYGTTVTDGSAQFQLVGPALSSDVWCMTNCYELFIEHTDMSTSMTHALRVDGSNSGQVFVSDSTLDSLGNDAQLNAGHGAYFNHNEFGGPYINLNNGILAQSSWGGTLSAIGNNFGMNSSTNGVNLSAGTIAIVSDNMFGGCATCISVSPGISGFNFIGNLFGATPGGGVGTAIMVSSGASDYYDIVYNICYTVSTCVTDNGTGSHKSVNNNH